MPRSVFGKSWRERRRAAVLVFGAMAAVVLAVAVGLGSLPDRGGAQEQSASASGSAAPGGAAKNVILVVGDGLGPAQRDMIQLATVGPYKRLVMDGLPYRGMVGTNSVASDDPPTFVTDSAAAATSMASGVKTFNGAIGVDADSEVVPTILEQAKAAGKAAGLVTTSQVTDATPAAFGAHVEDRDEQSEIARQFVEESRPDVILGGGEDYWYPEGSPGAYPDKRDEEDEEVSGSDRGNLVEAARGAGYEYVTDPGELRDAAGPKILGLFANEEMFQQFPEGEGAVYDPVVPLTEMTEKALGVLSRDPEGFFLMVEEEAIDEMGHVNNAKLQIKSGQQMDAAVAVAKRYAQQSGETLLITVGDHECCGLTVEAIDDPEYPDENGAEIKDNVSGEDGPFDIVGSDFELVVDATTTSHTGVDVPLTAMGPGAARLVGNYENTRIYDVMAESLGVAGVATTASPDASGSASAVPETGGPRPGWAAGVAALVAAAALLVVGRVRRGFSRPGGQGRERVP